MGGVFLNTFRIERVVEKIIQWWNKLHFRLRVGVGLGIVAVGIGICGLVFWVERRWHPIYMPKPVGYCRINLPEQRYQLLKGDFPYQFEYSLYAQVLESQSKYKGRYWMDLYYPDFDATIYISFQSVAKNPTLLKRLCKDASILAFKHQVKASSIEESVIKTLKGHQATIIELFGEVPTPFQFYTTDGQKHFLRGALYFKTASQNDFLEPVIEFIKKDIIHMLNTLEWKK